MQKGVQDGVYPGAVLLVAQGGEIVSLHKTGYRCLNPRRDPMKVDTIFDLASLTKPLATTLAIMKLVDNGDLALDQPLAVILPNVPPGDKGRLTPRLILSHCAGFADWKPFYLELNQVRPERKKALLRETIMEMPLVYPPGERSLYSDLGFMILEWVVEACSGMTLDRFLERRFYGPMSLRRTAFFNLYLPAGLDDRQFAATESCTWRKKVIQGSVHDENAHALGGYSGHAGLFSVAEEVYALAELLRGHYFQQRKDYLDPETVRLFFTRQDIRNGCTWALGWDTPAPQGSSAGRHFSAESVGHLGYTGCSLWMDLRHDVIVVLLSNRVHPDRKNDRINVFRPMLHDLIMEELGFEGG